jgi:AcrR family transcriptional regulator
MNDQINRPLNSARPSDESIDDPANARTHKERRELARRRILDAAYQIIAAGGLDELTLAGAGEAAGYSRALPGHYFGSKEELIAAIADEMIVTHARHMDSRSNSEGGLGNLLSSARIYLAEPTSISDTLRAFHSFLGASLTRAALRPAVKMLNERAVEDFAKLIREGQARGEIRAELDADVQGMIIIAGLRGLVAQWLQSPDDFPLDAARDAYVAQLEATLKA